MSTAYNVLEIISRLVCSREKYVIRVPENYKGQVRTEAL